MIPSEPLFVRGWGWRGLGETESKQERISEQPFTHLIVLVRQLLAEPKDVFRNLSNQHIPPSFFSAGILLDFLPHSLGPSASRALEVFSARNDDTKQYPEARRRCGSQIGLWEGRGISTSFPLVEPACLRCAADGEQSSFQSERNRNDFGSPIWGVDSVNPGG